MSERTQLATMLRQMIAVLENERQALAGLDLDALIASASNKQSLCDQLDAANDDATGDGAARDLDEECRTLTIQARQLNEVNRQVRNLLARNVAARLDALTGASPTYSAKARTSQNAASL